MLKHAFLKIESGDLYYTKRRKSLLFYIIMEFIIHLHFVKLRQGSGKDRQGMALKAKGLKA